MMAIAVASVKSLNALFIFPLCVALFIPPNRVSCLLLSLLLLLLAMRRRAEVGCWNDRVRVLPSRLSQPV